MQVHADTLPLAFQCLSQTQRALTKAFFARPRLGLDNRRLAGLFGGPQRKEIGRQQLRHITGIAHIIGAITAHPM